jgi:hypothetical protein
MTDPAVPAEPIPFRVLLDEAMKMTRRHFGTIYLLVAVPLAVLALVTVVLQQSFLQDMRGPGGAAAMFSGRGCAAFLATLALSVILQGLTSGVLTAAAVDGATHKPIDMKAKWGFILQPRSIGTLLLSFLAIMAGFICLILPGVYLTLGLSFVVPVMAAEGLYGSGALGRSWKLVRYNPHKGFLANTSTKVFLLFLVTGLIAYAINFVIQLPFTIMQGARMAHTIASGAVTDPRAIAGPVWVRIPSAILGSLVTTAVSIYASFGIVLLYLDVVRRKEGGDLAAAIDARFGGQPAPSAAPRG